MTDTKRLALPKSCVYVGIDGVPFLVKETPSEVVSILNDCSRRFAEFILANSGSEWNGRSVYVRPDSVTAISPPKVDEDDE